MFLQNSSIDILWQTFIFFYLLLAIDLVNVTGNDVKSEKFKTLEGYRIINIMETITSSTKLQCCNQCIKEAGCVSVNFRKNSSHLNCDVNWKTPLDANVSIEKIANSTVLYIDNDPWKLVFRVTAGRTTDPYYAWLNGTGTDNRDDCMMLYPSLCTSYYRHNLLNTWHNWSIKQTFRIPLASIKLKFNLVIKVNVKFALYKEHVLVAYIIFNGDGSDMQTWFSKDRVIQTSWTDLISSTQGFFSLKGDYDNGRYFFIHGPYGSCSTDYGWILINSGISQPCSFDRHTSYPCIIYASNGTKSIYNSEGYGEADVLAIYIEGN